MLFRVSGFEVMKNRRVTAVIRARSRDSAVRVAENAGIEVRRVESLPNEPSASISAPLVARPIAQDPTGPTNRDVALNIRLKPGPVIAGIALAVLFVLPVLIWSSTSRFHERDASDEPSAGGAQTANAQDAKEAHATNRMLTQPEKASPPEIDMGERTLRYWARAAEVQGRNSKHEAQLGQRITTATDIDNAMSLCAELAERLRAGSAELLALGAQGVDPDAVEFYGRVAALRYQIARSCEELRELMWQAKEFEAYYTSPAAFAEAFIRGAMGEPTGTLDDARAVEFALHERYRQLQTKRSNLVQEAENLDITKTTLKARLAHRYGSGFP